MIYIGHFWFVQDKANGLVDDDSCHGYFTTVAEAKDVEDALGRFRTLIDRLHNERDILDGIDEVFLDACVECKAIPASGFLAHFVAWTGQAQGSISTAIRGANGEQAVAYFLGLEGSGDESDGCDAKPFISFGS